MKTKNDVAKSVYLLLNIQALQCIIIHSKLLYNQTIPNSLPLENSLRSLLIQNFLFFSCL